MNDSLKKFQRLLRELFQFDCADLDFGIYRILNYKRDVVEKFITQDLPKAVVEELNRGALADQSQAAEELREVAEQIRETLGKDALDADGNLVETYHATPLGKKYLGLKQKAAGGRDRGALQATIFSHLYTFFSRYYHDGDFISKRRYSKRQKYAIPYNGEEVYLYWANHDQYYIKTAEHFHDYTFSSRGVTVHFKLVQADVEQNNIKGDKRFFLPRVKEINWDEEASQLVIPFEYRPLTEQEAITYGKNNHQEKIIAEALEEIPKRFPPKTAAQALAALTAERHKTTDGKSVSSLEHHLRQYTRRNTSDFFIHKDLKGFLTRELDFYLKNEVLNLDEIEAAGEERAEAWFQLMRVIKAIGGRIIEFLAQIEDFQKMLWEKRKFITETQYCITVGNIDESFYSGIAACEAQWDEWKELFHIDEEQANLITLGKSKKDKRIAFLKAHPTLVLDTKHFDQDFLDRLLASFDDLDELTDGLLVDSENWQALNLMVEQYQGQIECVYIDPPYNTGSDGFVYKDNYKSSSWLSMIQQSIISMFPILKETGSFFVSCDENEFLELGQLLLSFWGRHNHVETIIWNKRVPKNDKGIGNIHEYVYLFAKDQELRRKSGLTYLMKKDGLDEIYELVKKAKQQKLSLKETQEKLKQFYRKQGFDRGITLYCELDPNYELWGKINLSWPNPKTEGPRYKVINPLTGKAVPIPKNGWRWTEDTFRKAEQDGPEYLLPDGSMMRGKIWYAVDENTQPSSITYLREVESFLLRSIISLKSDGSLHLEKLGLAKFIDYPKPPKFIEWLFYSVGEKEGIFLDFFAGSGTSGQALIDLNREDNGKRKFILVEMGYYFDTLLLPRIKKVTFTPEWKDGKPKRMATQEEAERSPRIVKYIRLESYEDALNNIEFDEAFGQQASFWDDYLLQYMLKWETRKSETLLNVEKLASPFSYKLHIHTEGQTREKVVDIPETFNYLLGLHVKTRQVLHDGDRRYLVYRGRIDHREVVIIWRENKGWTEEDLERDKKFVAEQKLTEGADEVFVNGDSFIRGAKALEPVFKARMFAPVEA